MNFQDIVDWWSNIDEEDALKSQIIDRIGLYIRSSYNQPKNFQFQNFAGHLNLDRDAYALLASHFPEALAEIQKAVYGEQWNWKPEQVAKLLGFDKPENMFKRDKGEKALPQWMKLVEEGKDPSESLDTYYGSHENLEPGKLYKWLEAGQKQYDNKSKYTGGAANLARSVFTPRTQEALQRSGDYSWKDVIGDIGENVLQFIPWARPAAYAGKALRGMRGIGRIAPVVTQGAEMLASNAVAPLAGEVYDASVYKPLENPERASFNLSDVIGNTATNMATVPAIGLTTSGISRAAGVDNVTNRGVRDILSTDPVVTSIHRAQDLSNVGRGLSDLELKAEIYNKVFGVPRKKIKKLGKDQRADWENYYGIKDASTGNLDEDISKIGEILENTAINDPKRPTIEKIADEMLGIKAKPLNRQQSAYQEFLKHREEVTPTTILGNDANHYGLTPEGRFADISSVDFGMNPAHDLAPTTTEEFSAASILNDFKNERKSKARAEGKSFDEKYHRETEFDKAVKDLENDPNVVAKGTKSKWYLGPGFKSLGVNKAGKARYGERLIGEKLPNMSDIDDDTAAYLNDDTQLAIWAAGFVPHGDPEEPIMKAYKIAKANNFKRKQDEKP